MLNKQRSGFGLAVLIALMALVIGAISAVAQPVQQLPDKTLNPIDTSGLAGPPTVKITEAKQIPANGNNFHQVRVKWTAQTPNLTKLEGFAISVTTKDEKGSLTTNQTAAGSVRELVLQVQFRGKIQVTQTTIVTSFTTLATQKRELNGTFLLGKQEGSSGGPSSTPNANDAVTNVTIVDGSGFKSFDVFWRARLAPGVSEKQSKVSGTFTYKRGNQVLGTRTATATVGSGTRQARLTVSSSPVASLVDVRIEAVIKVETFFTVIQRITTSNP